MAYMSALSAYWVLLIFLPGQSNIILSQQIGKTEARIRDMNPVLAFWEFFVNHLFYLYGLFESDLLILIRKTPGAEFHLGETSPVC